MNISIVASWMLLGCLLSSCGGIKQPIFKYIEPPKVIGLKDGKLTIRSVAHLKNPNKMGLKLREMKLKVFSAGQEIGDFEQRKVVPIEGNSEFSLPFDMQLDWRRSQQGVLSTALLLWQRQEVKLTFKGYAKIGGKKKGFKVPVVYTEKLRVKW